MIQWTVPFVNRQISRLLVSVAVLLMTACAADEPEHVPKTNEKPAQPAESLPVREWYPTPNYQQTPYYAFPPAPGQDMQRQQTVTTPPARTGQGYNGARDTWTPASPGYYPQPDVPQYPAPAGGGGYGQGQIQQPVAQPQYGQPYPQYQYAPQYQQPYPPVPQYQQPYPPPAPQYQPAQRPWGAAGDSGSRSGTGRRSIDTWQLPAPYPGLAPPVYNGYTGQPGTTQYYVAPGYYR